MAPARRLADEQDGFAVGCQVRHGCLRSHHRRFQSHEPFPAARPARTPARRHERSFDHHAETGNAHHLKRHLIAQRPGGSENIIFSGEHYLAVWSTRSMAGSHYPDLLVAFDADPGAYRETNGYVISEQGKPLDLVLEIA